MDVTIGGKLFNSKKQVMQMGSYHIVVINFRVFPLTTTFKPCQKLTKFLNLKQCTYAQTTTPFTVKKNKYHLSLIIQHFKNAQL